jgi:hypothetical protein
VVWKFLGETGREVGEKMRGELGRRPIVSIAFLEARLCMAHLTVRILFSLQYDTFMGPTKHPNERT